MKVLVVGGTGVFGSRLARLLIRDGHQVTITGRRRSKMDRLSQEIGCDHLIFDRAGSFDELVATNPEVLVDAAGPFHGYEGDRYALPRACVAHRISYLDLSDDADFTAGISELDDAYRQAGCFALSGVSSVPALSSAAVSGLSSDFDGIDLIETAILPGNRAPRGRSVIESILAQVGQPMRVRRGGSWRTERCWSDPRTYEIFPGDRRKARSIRVPDHDLFPAFFTARSVTFRAAMELKVMNTAISAMAILSKWFGSTWPVRLAGLSEAIANRLEGFGSDTGGMIVHVTGNREGTSVRKSWALRVEAGDGPFIPCIPVRTLLRNPDAIRNGARACLAEFPIAEAEEAMADLAIRFDRTEEPRPPLFQRALKSAWNELPSEVRRLHSIQDIENFSGTAEVIRGKGLIARIAAMIFRFPVEGGNVPLTITKTRSGDGEIWERNFAGRRFRSYLTPAKPGHYRERFGPFNYEQELPVENGTMHLPVRRGWFLGIPLPRLLLPGSDSREFALDGRFHFDVALLAPITGGLIVRYRGTVSPDGEDRRSL
jgi:saccharopine dehydrogenase-like NADP-dependent oxidoreductase